VGARTGAQAGQRSHLQAERFARHHGHHDDPPTYAHHAAEETRDAACIAAPDRSRLGEQCGAHGTGGRHGHGRCASGGRHASGTLPTGRPRRATSLDIPPGAPSPLPRAGWPISPEGAVCGCCPLSDSVARCRALKSLLRFRANTTRLSTPMAPCGCSPTACALAGRPPTSNPLYCIISRAFVRGSSPARSRVLGTEEGRASVP
jgi:hypothetical protein